MIWAQHFSASHCRNQTTFGWMFSSHRHTLQCNWLWLISGFCSVFTKTQSSFVTLFITNWNVVCKHSVTIPSIFSKGCIYFAFFISVATHNRKHWTHSDLNGGKCSTSFHASFSEIRPWSISGQAEGHLIVICQNSPKSFASCLYFLSPPPPPPKPPSPPFLRWQSANHGETTSRWSRFQLGSSHHQPFLNGSSSDSQGPPPTHTKTNTHTQRWVIAGCVWLRAAHLQQVFFEEPTAQSHIRDEEANVKLDKHTNQAVSD